MLLADKNRISPPSPPASQPSAACSSFQQALAASTAVPLLPVGKQPVAGLRAIKRLQELYVELQHVEAAIYWIGLYLPKLALNDELASRKQQIQVEMAALTPKGSTCSTPDLSPSTADS
jgi:hypothetical protein